MGGGFAGEKVGGRSVMEAMMTLMVSSAGNHTGDVVHDKGYIVELNGQNKELAGAM